MKEIKRFCSKPIFVTSLVLLILALLLMLIDQYIFKTKFGDYVSGTITEILGIIVTILFVQYLFDKKSKSDQRLEELLKITRADRIVGVMIDRYSLFFHRMTHDYSKLASVKQSLDVNFNISDMKYLHEKCLLMNTDPSRSSVSIFYENELELRNIFISLIQNIDFEYFPEISLFLLDYINASFQNDSRGEILNNERLSLNGKPHINNIRSLLENNAEDYLKELQGGKLKHYSNAMFPYVRLYVMIMVQKEALVKYKIALENILIEKK